ncbi:MAG: hypothetical protein AAF198_10515 [Pseudomonadota bacterium]
MIRLELQKALFKSREILTYGFASVVFCFLSFWLGQLSLQILSVVASLAFATLAYLGWRHSILGNADGGQGVVEVTERAITYFGPYEGWKLSLDALEVVALSSDKGIPSANNYHWVIQTIEGMFYTVPAAASGAQTLGEELAFLPGIDLQKAARVIRTRQQGVFTIWRRDVGNEFAPTNSIS